MAHLVSMGLEKLRLVLAIYPDDAKGCTSSRSGNVNYILPGGNVANSRDETWFRGT